MQVDTEFQLTTPPSPPSQKQSFDVISSCSGSGCDENGQEVALMPQQPSTTTHLPPSLKTEDDDDDDDCCSSDNSSFYDDYDDDSSDDESCSEEETSMVKQLVSASFAKHGLVSGSMMARMLQQLQTPPPAKKIRYSSVDAYRKNLLARNASLPPISTSTSTTTAFTMSSQVSTTAANTINSSSIKGRLLRERLRLSQSAPCLVIKQKTSAQDASRSDGHDCRSPDECLRAVLRRKGYDSRTVPALELSTSGFFHKNDLSEAAVASYDMTLIQAIRNEDIDTLHRLQREEGRTLQCCNKFAESIVHTVSRRGSVKVLRFLVEEAKVSVRVCCDSGRTPLHDACWSAQPRFGIVGLLLDQCPDLLYVTDKRGFTPLAYVPRENWKDWSRYLDARGADNLVAKDQLLLKQQQPGKKD